MLTVLRMPGTRNTSITSLSAGLASEFGRSQSSAFLEYFLDLLSVSRMSPPTRIREPMGKETKGSGHTEYCQPVRPTQPQTHSWHRNLKTPYAQCRHCRQSLTARSNRVFGENRVRTAMQIFLISRDEGFVADYADDALFAYREYVGRRRANCGCRR